MNTNRAIPAGYQTVGELARQVGTTVRALQHYDRIGLLIPAGESAGGRRLYDSTDTVRLHQILALKQLGFSLNEIKSQLIDPTDPHAVEALLGQQTDGITEQIERLTKVRADLLVLREGVRRFGAVDVDRYAQILSLFALERDKMWVFSVAGESIIARVGEITQESSERILAEFSRIYREAARLSASGIAPSSPDGERLFDSLIAMVNEFSGGDPDVIADMSRLDEDRTKWAGSMRAEYEAGREFVEAITEYWTDQRDYNPFAGNRPGA